MWVGGVRGVMGVRFPSNRPSDGDDQPSSLSTHRPTWCCLDLQLTRTRHVRVCLSNVSPVKLLWNTTERQGASASPCCSARVAIASVLLERRSTTGGGPAGRAQAMRPGAVTGFPLGCRECGYRPTGYMG